MQVEKNYSTQRYFFWRTFIALFFGAVFLFALNRPGTNTVVALAKIDPALLSLPPDRVVEYLVMLEPQADLSPAPRLATKAEKGRFVYETLVQTAATTQQSLRDFLTQTDTRFQSFWIANMVLVRSDINLARTVAQRADVRFISANPAVLAALPAAALPSADAAAGVEWNINQINAPAVWSAGFTGAQVVIGGADTGYDWDHPALRNSYRGWDGTAANHSYSWHDAVHTGGGICGPDAAEPCDDWSSSHGTHTMGTMVGDDGGNNQVGVAPGARWIGCRNMNVGVGTPATYSECMQWFVAPTDSNNQNADPDMAPHVINNSWICPPDEGCGNPLILETIVNNVRAAGVVVVASAGNSGSACSTISAPPAIYDASFTVGSTNSGDLIASSSSRGPVVIDGSGRLKPDVTAPGVMIRSSVRNGGYSYLSGTSMAGPHAAGLIALLISAQPALAGDVDTLEAIVTQSALARTTTQSCGGVTGDSVPNNTYGYGRVDAYAALQHIPHHLAITNRVSTRHALPGATVTYTLTVAHQHPLETETGVVLQNTLPAGSSFVTATLPHEFDGSTVVWQIGTLDNAAVERTLSAALPPATPLIVRNDGYSVRGDNTPTQFGAAVLVLIGFDHDVLLPLLRRR